ncbi:MAG: F0F1 ATP synthase subunit B [Candidatus Dormibacteraceae bacterium]
MSGKLPLATAALLEINATLVIEIVAFLLLVGILARWVYPVITRVATARQQAISRALDQAEQDRQGAEARLKEATGQLEEARQQASQVVAGAGRSADQIRQEARERASAEAQRIAAAAAQDIEAERVRAIQSVRADVADLVARATERVIGESVDDQKHRQLIEQAIASVADDSVVSRN